MRNSIWEIMYSDPRGFKGKQGNKKNNQMVNRASRRVQEAQAKDLNTEIVATSTVTLKRRSRN